MKKGDDSWRIKAETEEIHFEPPVNVFDSYFFLFFSVLEKVLGWTVGPCWPFKHDFVPGKRSQCPCPDRPNSSKVAPGDQVSGMTNIWLEKNKIGFGQLTQYAGKCHICRKYC